MKFRYLSLVFALMLSMNAIAQPNVEITGFGGWLWTASIPAYLQDIKVTDEGNYGAMLSVGVRDQMRAGFEWNHTNNSAQYREYVVGGGLGELQNIPLSMNYYLLGFEYEATYDEPLVPYGLLNIGVLNVKADNDNVGASNSSANWFTMGLGGGLKYFIHDNIGIKLQARILLPMQFSSIGFGCGIGTGGGGCGTGVSTYTSIIQGDFTGGVVLKFGN